MISYVALFESFWETNKTQFGVLTAYSTDPYLHPFVLMFVSCSSFVFHDKYQSLPIWKKHNLEFCFGVGWGGSNIYLNQLEQLECREYDICWPAYCPSNICPIVHYEYNIGPIVQYAVYKMQYNLSYPETEFWGSWWRNCMPILSKGSSPLLHLYSWPISALHTVRGVLISQGVGPPSLRRT